MGLAHEIRNLLGDYLAKNGKTQLRIAETEKYAHVTFFFSAGEEPIPGADSRKLCNSIRQRGQLDPIYIERGVFAGAGTFVTRVRSVKALGERYVAVCDGGLSHNFLLAKTESMLKNYAQPRVLRRQQAPVDAPQLPTQFVGSTCSRADVIGWNHGVSAPPSVGDLVIFENCVTTNCSP